MKEYDLVSLVIPCYNEQESLPYLYEELDKITEKLQKFGFEFLFINDGSKDRTSDILLKYAESDPRVRYFGFSRNFGKEAAMFAGFCNARGKYVAVMDADMQDPPSLLPSMLEILTGQGYDSVAARRVDRTGEPRIRSWFARLF